MPPICLQYIESSFKSEDTTLSIWTLGGLSIIVLSGAAIFIYPVSKVKLLYDVLTINLTPGEDVPGWCTENQGSVYHLSNFLSFPLYSVWSKHIKALYF